jgi:hypothetical protein
MGMAEEYHRLMRRSISASIGLVSAMALVLLFVAPSHAQVNGTPASVTSPGFGGNPVNGTRPSVTSLGPHGFPSGPAFVGSIDGRHHDGGKNRGRGKDKDGDRDHHRGDNQFVGPMWYAVPVPYGVDDNGAADTADADANEPDDQGGPTVFDHHGPPPRAFDPWEKDAHPAHAQKPAEHVAEDEPPAEPEAPQEPTLLVFKDGRSVEVGNYAIQGATLFDLTPGHKRKIALMDLDLEATRRQNEERGVMFQLPSSYKAN